MLVLDFGLPLKILVDVSTHKILSLGLKLWNTTADVLFSIVKVLDLRLYSFELE